MQIDRIDHLVITVADIQHTCRFYSSLLNMQVEEFDGQRVALRFGNQKINLHKAGKEIVPKAANPTVGSGDMCFITTTSMAKVMKRLQQYGTEIIEGPTERSGAYGPILSVYFRDPDGNLLEVANSLSTSS